MALNLQPEQVDGRALQLNQRALERHLNDDHYVRRFTSGDFILLTATSTLDPVANDWPWIAMANAVTSHAAVSFRKPSEWRSGKVRVRYWYTSDVGSTSNFNILVSMKAVRDAEVIPGTTLLLAASNVAGPAVAYTVIRSAYVYSTMSFGNDDELISLRIVRAGGDAGDTNVNDFKLLYVELEHIPARQVSQ